MHIVMFAADTATTLCQDKHKDNDLHLPAELPEFTHKNHYFDSGSIPALGFAIVLRHSNSTDCWMLFQYLH